MGLNFLTGDKTGDKLEEITMNNPLASIIFNYEGGE